MGMSKIKPGGDSAALMLPPDCSVRTIATIAADARDRMAADGGIALDGSAVQSADMTFVQFVVSARKLCEARSAPFRLESLSDAGLSAFARAGVPVPAASSLPGAL